MLLLKSRDRPVGWRIFGRVYTLFDRPGEMRTDCVICLWFWSLPDSLEVEWLYTYMHFVAVCLTIRTDLAQFGLARCYMHRMRHLSPYFWASPMQHKILKIFYHCCFLWQLYFMEIMSITWLQMACLLASPGHQHWRDWTYNQKGIWILPSRLSATCIIFVSGNKIKLPILVVPKVNSIQQGFICLEY